MYMSNVWICAIDHILYFPCSEIVASIKDFQTEQYLRLQLLYYPTLKLLFLVNYAYAGTLLGCIF